MNGEESRDLAGGRENLFLHGWWKPAAWMFLPLAWVILDTALEAESIRWVWKLSEAGEKIGLPFWVPILGFLVFPFFLPLTALRRGRLQLALVQWVALAGITVLEAAVVWFLAERGLLIRVSSVHPFPGSLAAASVAGVEVGEPLDPNDWGLRGLPVPPVPEAGRPGAVDVELWKASGEGIFAARIWANPGEAGELFLRVCEFSTGKPVAESAPAGSLERNITRASRHPARFSGDAGRVFCTTTPEFKVFEGGQEYFFAGRVDLWFAPEAGGDPRQLGARVFRMNGWGR